MEITVARRRRTVLAVLAAFAVGFALMASMGAADAATTRGTTKQLTTNGVTYNHYANINVSNPGSSWAYAGSFTSGGQAGWAGGKGTLYRSDGTTLSTSTVRYSTGTSVNATTSTYSGKGNYYSKGLAYGWNASTQGYAGASNDRSPNLSTP